MDWSGVKWSGVEWSGVEWWSLFCRTKAERAADVKLPPLEIKVHATEMDEVERDFYESLYMLTRAKFDGYVKKGSVLHNYAHIFELLSRLRQTCDHPYLVVHSRTAVGGGAIAPNSFDPLLLKGVRFQMVKYVN